MQDYTNHDELDEADMDFQISSSVSRIGRSADRSADLPTYHPHGQVQNSSESRNGQRLVAEACPDMQSHSYCWLSSHCKSQGR